MNVIHWNSRGYTLSNTELLARLVRRSTILCVRETYNAIPDTDYWRSISVQAPPTVGRYRRGGGVAILHAGEHTIVRTHVYAEETFPFTAASVDGVPIVAAYVAPDTNRQTFDRFLALITRELRGPGVLACDVNARHKSWDEKTNSADRLMYLWAQAHNCHTPRPRRPTFSSQKGFSRVRRRKRVLRSSYSMCPPHVLQYQHAGIHTLINGHE